ncbi:MAG: MFS transporter [Actinobacteria bacterium]|jgi:MFS family permease|nr:MFS transporter [Actinomycetota bacterium]MCL6094488.1 MFS transporter [Actinomycetota bacterium]
MSEKEVVSSPEVALPGSGVAKVAPNYKWIALSNTTLGALMASLNATSLIIALPVIFRGIHLNPLNPSNFNYLLWILMGYMLVSAVFVVTLGRIGDIFGRVKIYNLGFVVFTVGAILLSLTPGTGSTAALELVIFRMVQAVGGAMLMANSAAILTDAFPSNQLGLALGTNMLAMMAGSFLGILAGGLLSQVGWRWVFLVNVPIGIAGTIWAYLMLKEIGVHIKAKIDWLGNLTFAAGLAMVLVGITYGIKPYGTSSMGWGNPFVLAMIAGGVVLLVLFVVVEFHVEQPMFKMELFNIRPFAAGNLAGFLGAVGRGGMQFMLIIWFQGIWLPQHGYSFTVTPLWAGIFMIPWTLGFVAMGPLSGTLSDRYGARPFATGGMVLTAIAYLLMLQFPANFNYPLFAVVLALSGLAMGMFASPNTSAIMNSVPARHRGAASGMRVTFMNSGMPLSIGLFFTLMIIGLNAKVPHAMFAGLVANGIPAAKAASIAHMPAIGYLFAAFLGYNPLKTLLGPKVLSALPAAKVAHLTSRSFFPQLISPPFKHGLSYILVFAIITSLVAAAASWMRGKKFIHEEALQHSAGGAAMAHAARLAAEQSGGSSEPSDEHVVGELVDRFAGSTSRNGESELAVDRRSSPDEVVSPNLSIKEDT